MKSPADIYDDLYSSREYCSWCFGRRRRLHPEFDREAAEYFKGDNYAAFDALGHRLSYEMGVDVNSREEVIAVNESSSTPDPAMIRSIAPATVIDDSGGDLFPDDDDLERRGEQVKYVCPCGQVDIDYNDARGTGDLLLAIENFAREHRRRDIDFRERAGKAMIQTLRKRDDLQGKDRGVLIRAIRFARKKG